MILCNGLHMSTSKLLTSPQVAAILGKSHRSVHRMVEDGRLPVAQKLPGPNGAFLFSPEVVEELRAQLTTDRDGAVVGS